MRALDRDLEVTVFLVASGVDWVRKGAAEVAHLNPFNPPVKDLIGNVMSNGEAKFSCVRLVRRCVATLPKTSSMV